MMKYLLQYVLKLSMVMALFGSFLILTSGLFLHFCLNSLLEKYFGKARDLNTTMFLINSAESIVPTKDDLPEEIDLGTWPRFIALVISGVGGSLFLFALFGYIAVTSKNADYLLCLVFLITVGLVCQFLVFGCIVDLSSQVSSLPPNHNVFTFTKERLITTLHGNYEIGARTNSTFTFMMNSIMLMGDCCGIDGPFDFLEMGTFNFSYVLDGRNYYDTIYFPLACCNRSYIDKGFQATLACAKSREISNINNKGCYEEAYVYMDYKYGKWITAVFVLLIVFEMVQILTGLSILFAPSKVEREAFKHVLATAEYENLNKRAFKMGESFIEGNPNERMTIFVPFAKIPVCEYKDGMATQIW